MYEIRFTPEARRDFARIPNKARPAIFELIDGAIAANPKRVGKALRLDLEGGTEQRAASTGSSIGSGRTKAP